MKTRHITIMFTDIKGFTKRTSLMPRKKVSHLLKTHDHLIRPLFKKFGGKIVKTIGDAFMVTFESPTNAVLCGMKIQKVLTEHNERSSVEDQLEVRVAINSGEVHSKGKDVFGEAVNIASRVEGITNENEIYLTEAVYLSMNKNEIACEEVGRKKLKGIPEEIKIFKVLMEEIHASAFHKKRAKLLEIEMWKKIAISIFALAVLGLIIYLSLALKEKNSETTLTPQVQTPSQIDQCEGCFFDGDCIPFGTVTEGRYCDKDKRLRNVKPAGTACTEAYECRSTKCISGTCILPVLREGMTV